MKVFSDLWTFLKNHNVILSDPTERVRISLFLFLIAIFSVTSLHANPCAAECPCYYTTDGGHTFVKGGENVRFSNGLWKNNCNDHWVYIPTLRKQCMRENPDKDPAQLAHVLSAKQCKIEMTGKK